MNINYFINCFFSGRSLRVFFCIFFGVFVNNVNCAAWRTNCTENHNLHLSNNLTHRIFASKWYDIKSIKLKRNIVFVIKNAQVPAKITAFKVFALDYSTYIKVLRLSFSFYTLLSSMVEVKN
ncbi:unnamed protein product [Psylliodes chrysocephalus]|uniref:Uncharacterized protein n=1 Tax=Psylliodes chrysocephalus TaxID=3402493 RepID=A0A9P0CPR0_9CUCU|nr:unnamed protein product [Psylliodes chrysocephala]